MWISKRDYNELVNSKNFWEKAYEERVNNSMALLLEVGDKLKLMDSIELENSELKEQVEEYKKKYADELQRRLELIKLLESTP